MLKAAPKGVGKSILLWTEGMTLMLFTGVWNYWKLPVIFKSSSFPMTQVNVDFHMIRNRTHYLPNETASGYHRSAIDFGRAVKNLRMQQKDSKERHSCLATPFFASIFFIFTALLRRWCFSAT